MNYTLRTSYSLRNSFDKARSIVGYLHASVIDSTEREVIFYQTADAYLRYAVTDENTELGYSVYKTSISGALLDVCAYLDMFGCPFAIVDCLQTPHGMRRTYTIQFNFQDNKADIRELQSDDVYTSLIGRSAFSRRSEEYFARAYYRDGDGNGCRLVFGKRLYEYKPEFSISQVDADSLGKYAAPAFVESNLSVKYGIVILPGRYGSKGKLPMEIYKSGQLTKKIVNMPIDYEFRVWNFKTVMASNGNCVAYVLVSYTDKNKCLRYAIVELSGDELFSDNRIVWNGDDISAFDVTHSVINDEERTEIVYSRERCLYHFYVPMNRKSKVSDAVPIARDVYTFHFSIDASEPNVSAFIQRFNDAIYDAKLGDVSKCVANWNAESQEDAGTNGIGEIFKLELSPASGAWIEESINVDDEEEQIIKRNSYVTRIAVLDENKVATSKSFKASLRAFSYMHVQVNGKGYDIGPDKAVDVKTDIRGELVVTHDAYCISEEDIFLEVKSPDDKIICDDKDVLYLGAEESRLVSGQASVMASGQASLVSGLTSAVSFRGSRGIESRLINCSGDMLMKAKDLKGAYIVPGSLRNLNSMNDFAKTVRDLLNVKTASEACFSDGNFAPMRTVVRTTSYGCFTSGRKGFFFSVEDGQAINREIDAAEFDRILSEWKEEGAKEFFSSIGDFFRAAAKGLVNSIKTIATVAGNTIKTAINFVMNGIRYVINTVVEVIQQILDIVETLFVQLTVPFVKLLEWLGDPFDFEGMRLAAQLGDAILACGEEFLKKSIYYAKKKSSQFLKDAKSCFEEAIGQIDKSSYNNATMSYLNAKGRYFQSMYQIPESDFVSDCIFDHMGDVQLVGGDAVLRDLESVVSSIESVFNDISAISDEVGGEAEFQSAEKDFSNAAMTGSIWQRLFSAILKAFKALGEKFFDATDKMITKLLDYAAELLPSIRQICDIRIHIPVLSVLYRSIYNKDRMTIRDLFLFSFSLTANTSSHMFCDNKRLWFLEDSAAVESAKSDIKAVIDSFDPDKMDEGLAGESTDKESLYEASKGVQKIFDIASCWCQILSYGASAGSDALVVFKAIQGEAVETGEVGETGEEEEKRYIDGHYELKMDGLDIAGFVLDGVTAFAEIVWVSISMPAWSGDQNNILSVGAWTVCAVQCVMDIILIVVGVVNRIPEKAVNMVSCVIASLFGVMYCIFSIWNVIKNVEEYKGFEIFNEAVMSLTAMLRFLLIKYLVVASSGVTAAVCMETDFIAAVSGVARFVLLVDNSSSALSAEFSSDLSSGFGWESVSFECVGGA